MKIYTKNGDQGFSETMTLKNIPKNSTVFEVLGTIDELNCWLGMSKTACNLESGKAENCDEKISSDIYKELELLQHDLFALSGELAGGNLFATSKEALKLEKLIDKYYETVPPMKGFAVPGGNELSARLDVSRTVARRAERLAVGFEGVSNDVLTYINRLSDLLFVLARKSDEIFS